MGGEYLARPAVDTAKSVPPSRRTPRTGDTRRPGAADLLLLQRTVGNAAVAALVRQSSRAGPPRSDHQPVVQRAPDTEHTLTWEVTDSSKDSAALHRTTKIEADAWGEVGPAPPRVKYDRRVDLETRDGITVSLRINVTVYLPVGEKLPRTPEEALSRIGRHVRGGRYFTASGGALDSFNEDQYYDSGTAVSLRKLSEGFPDYALLALTAKQQEAAILRKLSSLPRRDVRASESGGQSAGGGESTLKERIKQGIDLVTDFIPGVSNIKDFSIFLTGINPVTGEKVGWPGRILALIFAIPVIGTVLKYVGKGAKYVGKLLLVPLVKIGWRIALKSAALVRWIAKTRAAALLAKAGKRVAHGVEERVGRLAEKLGLRAARIGHATPWDKMTAKQRSAFQHSYSNHAKDFNLPNWKGKSAESLRQQFNAAAGAVRENAQRITLRYKPVNGITEPVRYFQYTDKAGARWYYFERLKGDFVSAGREVR